MGEISTTVVVAGAGPAGLAAALLLQREGIDCVLVGPPAAEDPRTMALMAPSLKFLDRLGLWTEALKSQCAPLRELHILDDTGNMVEAPPLRFKASELNLEAFGWNVPLAALVPAFRALCEARGIKIVPALVQSVDLDGERVVLHLDTGNAVIAQAAIAADGSKSLLRAAAGIGTESWSFDQDALVTRFDHSGSHGDVSTEWHRQNGVFTTVPMPGHHSSLVWLDKPAEIERLMALPQAEMAKEIQIASHGQLGLISNVWPTRRFAMRGISAHCYAARRVFLVGEAAHVFPPVGAQGLNMSLRDIGHAVEQMCAGADPGSASVQAGYEAARKPDIEPRQLAISAVNHSLLAETFAPHALRALGLRAMSLVPPLRDYVMREGLSPQSRLPRMMQG